MQLLQEVDIFIMARNLLLRRLFMEGIICKSEGAGLSTAWTRHRLRLLLCERCHRTALFLKRSSIFCMLVKKVQYWKLKVDNRELRSMSINFLCILPVYLYNFIVQITCSFIFKWVLKVRKIFLGKHLLFVFLILKGMSYVNFFQCINEDFNFSSGWVFSYYLTRCVSSYSTLCHGTGEQD